MSSNAATARDSLSAQLTTDFNTRADSVSSTAAAGLASAANARVSASSIAYQGDRSLSAQFTGLYDQLVLYKLNTSGGIITGDLRINGALTVSGSSTQLNTETLLVEDNIIELNKTGSAITADTAGLSIYRGASVSAANITFTSSTSSWTISDYLQLDRVLDSTGSAGSADQFLSRSSDGTTKWASATADLASVNSRIDTVSSAVSATAAARNTVSSNAATARNSLSAQLTTDFNARGDSVSSNAVTARSSLSAQLTTDFNARGDSVSSNAASAVSTVTPYTNTAVQTYLDGGTASATLSAVRLNSVHIENGSLTGSEFKALHGSRIVKNGGTNCSYSSFQPAAADVGKTWTILNPSGYEITLNFSGQYVHVMNGSEASGRKTNWKLEQGAVAEIICIDSAANGGSSSSDANFVIYGTGIVDL